MLKSLEWQNNFISVVFIRGFSSSQFSNVEAPITISTLGIRMANSNPSVEGKIVISQHSLSRIMDLSLGCTYASYGLSTSDHYSIPHIAFILYRL